MANKHTHHSLCMSNRALHDFHLMYSCQTLWSNWFSFVDTFAQCCSDPWYWWTMGWAFDLYYALQLGLNSLNYNRATSTPSLVMSFDANWPHTLAPIFLSSLYKFPIFLCLNHRFVRLDALKMRSNKRWWSNNKKNFLWFSWHFHMKKENNWKAAIDWSKFDSTCLNWIWWVTFRNQIYCIMCILWNFENKQITKTQSIFVQTFNLPQLRSSWPYGQFISPSQTCCELIQRFSPQ